jgi:SNF2 family DNA or RNA helicase
VERQSEIQKLEKQLETITNKISTISSRIKESDLCTICFDTTENKTVTSCCQNAFCFKCINLWLSQKNVCPLCKMNMGLSDLYVIDNNVIENMDTYSDDESAVTRTKRTNDKYQNLEIILQTLNDNAKILLFSAYENSFNNVIPILKNNNIQFEYLKGNGNQINCTVERYKSGQTKVLLVNTRQYGSGLCLENTTDMIMFHKFDTEIEKQVIGRAQRYGRKEPLNIHYLLYENEMPAQAAL